MHKHRLLGFVLFTLFIGHITACAPNVIFEVEDMADKMIDEGTLHSAYIGGLHYVESLNNSGSDLSVVFVHGTPGDWKIFAYQLNDQSLQQHAHLIAIDRPSWGQSSQLFNDDFKSFEAQSTGISCLLKSIRQTKPDGKIVIVGHSYGGSLVPQIALDYPELVDLGIILAGNLTSKHTITRWYNRVASWPLIQKILPNMMNNSNIEMLALPKNIGDMNNRWPSLTKPLIVIQGKQDILVEYEHALFAKTLTTSSTVEVKIEDDWGHLFLLNNNKKLNHFLTQKIQALKESKPLLSKVAPPSF